MMKKFNKKKGSRQGAILVTVVFILAFAIIFIAAAMMLTQSRRKRVYKEAESNQARLTVTSVSEAFYRAIQKCEWGDDKILGLVGSTIRVQASATSDTIPGLETVGHTSTDSYTTCHFYSVHKGAGYGTDDDDYDYYADFSTHIGDQVENVRAKMTYTKPLPNNQNKPFSAQVDLNGKFANSNLQVVGEGKTDDPDNIFLVRHGGKNTDAGFSSYATLIYCDGAVSFKDDIHHSKDIVFLSGAYLANLSDSTNISSSSSVENLIFFGDANQPIAQGTKGNFSASGLTFWLCNRADVPSWTEGAAHVYKLYTDGTSPDVTTSDAFRQRVQKYASYNASYKAGGTQNFPTTDDFIETVKDKYNITKNPPSGGQSFGDWIKSKCFQATNSALPGGTYVFNSDDMDTNEKHKLADGTELGAKEPYVVVLEGTSDYRFWFKSGSYGLFNVVFIIKNPKPSHPALFLLADGAKIYWPGKYNAYLYDNAGNHTPGYDTSSDGKVCGNGILAVEGRNFDTAEDAFNFVKNCSATTVKNFDNNSGKYSTHYNAVNESCAMVLGMGKNVFKTDKNIILECFIGMFNESYDPDNPKSHVSFRNGDSGVFYGRIMTDGLNFNGDSGAITMPAAPGASSMPNNDPGIKKAVTGFSLVSMQYYYITSTT